MMRGGERAWEWWEWWEGVGAVGAVGDSPRTPEGGQAASGGTSNW